MGYKYSIQDLEMGAEMGVEKLAQAGKISYNVQMRERIPYPTKSFQLPLPDDPPSKVPALNLWTTLLPPAFIIIGMVIYSIVLKSSNSGGVSSISFMVPMIFLALGFPAANLIGLVFQRKSYNKELQARGERYRADLMRVEDQILSVIEQQRNSFHAEHPPLNETLLTAYEQRKQLWWRRSKDNDYLWLRYGTGIGKTTFSVLPPQSSDGKDPLLKQAYALVDKYQQVDNLPSCLDLKKLGSIAIESTPEDFSYRIAYRLLVDMLVHHSPHDIEIIVLSDADDANLRWEFLKWAPHTKVLDINNDLSNLAFDASAIQTQIRRLNRIYKSRQEQTVNVTNPNVFTPVYNVILDDNGIARQTSEIASLAENGHNYGINLLFINKPFPNQCRGRLDVFENSAFDYRETYDGESVGLRAYGKAEFASKEDVEKAARALAPIETAIAVHTTSLPTSIRFSELFSTFRNQDIETEDAVLANWSKEPIPDDLLKFPIGFRKPVGRKELETVFIDFREGDHGGESRFSAVILGMPGSGKSVMLHSLLMSAAVQYSPRIINFLLMDFKGGNEFDIWKNCPHTVGVVNNKPGDIENAYRAMLALQHEKIRREKILGGVDASNIWGYYQKKGFSLPLLMVVIDEFAEGLLDEQLKKDLEPLMSSLVQSGRSLGMFMVLANQKLLPEIEKLLQLTHWRVVFRVADRGPLQELLHCGTDIAIPQQPGRGLTRIREELVEFQAARNDQPINKEDISDVDEIRLLKITPSGRLDLFYKYFPEGRIQSKEAGPSNPIKEREEVIRLSEKVAQINGIEKSSKIYLDPLDDEIPLKDIIQDDASYRVFRENQWQSQASESFRLVVPLGKLDYPQICRQDILKIDFRLKDGNLWIVGGPGTGMEMTLESLVLSLIKTHSPNDIKLYLLDFGGNFPERFRELPHTRAFVTDRGELLDRVFDDLDSELASRKSFYSSTHDDEGESVSRPAALFVILNDFSAFIQKDKDSEFLEKVATLISQGKIADIHVILTSNQFLNVHQKISNNIRMRIGLGINSSEYYDLFKSKMVMVSRTGEGRGYWSNGDKDSIAECQIAQPLIDAVVSSQQLLDLMIREWKEPNDKIPVAPTCYPIENVQIPDGCIHVGMCYDCLKEAIDVNLGDESPYWWITGQLQKGKSNFIATTAYSLLNDPSWEIFAISLRKNPLNTLAKNNRRLLLISKLEQIEPEVKKLIAAYETNQETDSQHLLVLIDDLGYILDSGNGNNIKEVLTDLARLPNRNSRVRIMAAGQKDQLIKYTNHELVNLLKNSKTGIAFTNNIEEIDWLIPEPYKQIPPKQKKMSLPPGRGFFVSRGVPKLIQTPFSGVCPENGLGDLHKKR